MLALPYDVHNPPEKAPDSADKIMWSLARLLREEHVEGPPGLCNARHCRQFSAPWPCMTRAFADSGLILAAFPPATQAHLQQVAAQLDLTVGGATVEAAACVNVINLAARRLARRGPCSTQPSRWPS